MLMYIVKAGDTLATIAAKILGDKSRYKEFMQWNPAITDPNKISVGQVIQYPVMASLAQPEYGPQMAPTSTAQQVSPVTMTAGVTLPKTVEPASKPLEIPAFLKDPKVYLIIAAIAAAVVITPKGKIAMAKNPPAWDKRRWKIGNKICCARHLDQLLCKNPESKYEKAEPAAKCSYC